MLRQLGRATEEKDRFLNVLVTLQFNSQSAISKEMSSDTSA